ncbi:hypothetical protein QYF36_006929 [Acer negundo]|nr:hypothetical protein QYF36_006929 [Acer negundo]
MQRSKGVHYEFQTQTQFTDLHFLCYQTPVQLNLSSKIETQTLATHKHIIIHQISSSLTIIHISQTLATYKHTTIPTINHPQTSSQSTPDVRRRLSHHAVTRRQHTATYNQTTPTHRSEPYRGCGNRDRSRLKTGVLVDLVSRLAFVLVDNQRFKTIDLHQRFFVLFLGVSWLFQLGFGGGGCGGRGSLLTRIQILLKILNFVLVGDLKV